MKKLGKGFFGKNPKEIKQEYDNYCSLVNREGRFMGCVDDNLTVSVIAKQNNKVDNQELQEAPLQKYVMQIYSNKNEDEKVSIINNSFMMGEAFLSISSIKTETLEQITREREGFYIDEVGKVREFKPDECIIYTSYFYNQIRTTNMVEELDFSPEQ